MEEKKTVIGQLLKEMEKVNISCKDFTHLLEQGESLVDKNTTIEEEVSLLSYRLGEYHLMAENWGKSEKYWKLCLSWNEQLFGPGHPYTAAARSNLGNLYLKKGDYFEAIAHLRFAVEQIENNIGTDSAFAVITYCRLGGAHRALRENGKATAYFTKALVAAEAMEPRGRLSSNIYLNLGELYQEIDPNSDEAVIQAKEYFKTALSLFREELGIEHDICRYLEERIFACDITK